MSAVTLAPAMVDFLLSPCGRAAAAELADADLDADQTFVRLAELRKRFSADEAAALLTLARLRRRASAKWPAAEGLFLTPETFEQATAWPLACHRAAWLHRHAPLGPLLDLGCGIGGDTLALAQHRPVIAFDRDPAALRFAAANADRLGVAARIEFRLADWTEELAAGRLPAAAAAFVDPSRRRAGRRLFDPEELEPPLSTVLALEKALPTFGVKLMPGIDESRIPPGCGVEFVGHAGVCKEAVLWFGLPAAGRRWASVHTGSAWDEIEASGRRPPLGELTPGQALYEPHPAVIRAGAFAELCAQLEAHLFDPQIAYLVGPHARRHPLVGHFVVEEVHRFNLKLLNRRLQELRIGRVELKKRGFAGEPEALRRRLKLAEGGRSAVLFFTRRGQEPLMIIGRRMDDDGKDFA